ncbi:hypothetical protein DFH05DRAFT_1494587 [Lentinula detonsa]|uniref:Uncharacterized protein n=1 Tax=Lentinula detonsa TaxID=2804962 RepID=A0A9W8P0I5_9AGAR|nr:hypothetical protein DFH05DRAFT_1494587 [Lentinula detonsa]
MSTLSSSKPNNPKTKVVNMPNSNGLAGARTGIPTLRSLRTLFAPASSQAKPIQVSPSRPSLNLPASKLPMNLMPSRSSLNISSSGNDTSSSTSSLDVVRRSMTLGRKEGSRGVSRDSRDATKSQEKGNMDAVMDIRSSTLCHICFLQSKTITNSIIIGSPEILDGGGVDLSTIVEADSSGVSGLSLAQSLSKHLPSLPTSDSPPPSSDYHSPSPTFSPSPSPKPRSTSASVSSLHLPRSPSSIHAQVHSALQVDPALAALLSPNNLPSSTFSPGSGSGPPSPAASTYTLSTKNKSQSSYSLLPQHASTPHSSLRIKNASHLGLIRPSYIQSPNTDDSRSSANSISRPGSSASGAGTSLAASASASGSRHTSSAPRIRTRSMSVDEQSPRHLPGASSRRNPSVLFHRQNYAAHTRSLSQFGNHNVTQSEIGDVRPSSQRKAYQRPPITEWLGPRTAKAFKAAGLLSGSNEFGSNSSQQSPSYSESRSPSLSVPSSPIRPRFRPASSYTFESSPHSSNSSSPSPPYPRSVSVAASAVSARSGGSIRSASIRSGSIRSASTAPTSLSTGLGPSTPAQAAREYLMQSQSQQQKIASSFSSSTLNLPPMTSFAPSLAVVGAAPSELQVLKDQHSTETSALLAALSDAQRSARILRAENAELREALSLAENRQDSWEQERLRLKSRLEEVEAQLEEARGPKREVLKTREEIKVLYKVKAELESKLDDAETRAMQVEAKLCVMNEVRNKNQTLRQALHAVQSEKARVEAEAEMRAEEALQRIEQLESALAEASGAIGATIGMAKVTDGMIPDENEVGLHVDHGALCSVRSETDFRARHRTKLRTSAESSPPSSSSSSRPPSVFPVPPENMTLLMHEEAEGVTGLGERSASSELDDLSSLDAIEYQWRQSMDMPTMNGHPSTSSSKHMSKPRYTPLGSSLDPLSRLGMTSSPKMARINTSDDHDFLYPLHGSPVDHSILSKRPVHSDYDEDEAIVGNTTFYDADSAEGDSIISEVDPHLDPDPTVRSTLHWNPQLHESLSRSASHNSHHVPLKLATTTSSIQTRDGAEQGIEDDDATTSFEGTGTPGSPGSLLWMHPSDERHLGDLSGSMDSLRLGG